MTTVARNAGRQANAAELLAVVRRDIRRPLRAQLEDALRDAIRGGRLAADTRLPSSRTLASDLGVSRGVVTEAYAQLAAEGYLTARPRSGVRVARVATFVPPPARIAPPADRPQYDMRPGVPDLSIFPAHDWRLSLKEAVAQLPTDRLAYGSAKGAEELRSALARYLSRVRGVQVTSERVVIVTGFAQGLALLCATLRTTGVTTLAIEDPSSPRQRAFLARGGLRLRSMAVDARGARTDVLRTLRNGACLVTPAHQYPMGVVLAAERRAELLAWAEQSGGVIIEDDYDAEFRYDRAPVGAMQGLAPESVIYAGSASKTLAPALRLGWLVVPERFVDTLSAAKHDADLGCPLLEQLTFARLLDSGRFERHLRRARALYRRRRDTLAKALAETAPDWSAAGVAAGLHVVATPNHAFDDVRFCASAASRGVAAEPLSAYHFDAGSPGLILGYGQIPADAIPHALGRLMKS